VEISFFFVGRAAYRMKEDNAAERSPLQEKFGLTLSSREA